MLSQNDDKLDLIDYMLSFKKFCGQLTIFITQRKNK